MVAKEIRARYSHGKIEPLESIDLEEGEEITIVVKESASTDAARAALRRAAGAWAGTLDFDAYIEDLRRNRSLPPREVSL